MVGILFVVLVLGLLLCWCWCWCCLFFLCVFFQWKTKNKHKNIHSKKKHLQFTRDFALSSVFCGIPRCIKLFAYVCVVRTCVLAFVGLLFSAEKTLFRGFGNVQKKTLTKLWYDWSFHISNDWNLFDEFHWFKSIHNFHSFHWIDNV